MEEKEQLILAVALGKKTENLSIKFGQDIGKAVDSFCKLHGLKAPLNNQLKRLAQEERERVLKEIKGPQTATKPTPPKGVASYVSHLNYAQKREQKLRNKVIENSQKIQKSGNYPGVSESSQKSDRPTTKKTLEEMQDLPNYPRNEDRSTFGEDFTIHNKLYEQGLLSTKRKHLATVSNDAQAEQRIRKQEDKKGTSSQSIVKRLYYRGMASQENKRQKEQAIKAQEEQANYSFKPTVSLKSALLAQKDRSQNQQTQTKQKIEDYLLAKGQQKDQRLEVLSLKQQLKDLQEVQTKPKINQISRQLIEERYREAQELDPEDPYAQPGTHAGLRLYQEGLALKQKQLLVPGEEETCSFRPEVNLVSERIVYDKFGSQKVLDRFDRFENERAQKLLLSTAAVYPELTETINPETGLPYFCPQTTGVEPQSRPPQGLDVGSYLHSLGQQKMDKLEKKRREVYSRDKTVLPANKISSEIIEDRKEKTFKAIFAALDSDLDGVLSADKVSIESLDGETLKIISPLLINMEELQMEIDEQTFTYGMSEIYGKLSVKDRQTILAFLRPPKPTDDPDFQPSLCPRSLSIAQGAPSLLARTDRTVRQRLQAREEACPSEPSQPESPRPLLTEYQPAHSCYV